MKCYDVVGWMGEAELLCDDCAHAGGFDGPDGTPVFASDAQPGDYCAACLDKWIHETAPKDREEGAPLWVYLDGCEPEEGASK